MQLQLKAFVVILADLTFREEPTTSILQQHHGHILRWVEEMRSRHEVRFEEPAQSDKV